jgi:hypothetical protein
MTDVENQIKRNLVQMPGQVKLKKDERFKVQGSEFKVQGI